MPHTTHAYPFEAKVLGFASGLCCRFTRDRELRPFRLMLDVGGNATSVLFGDHIEDWHTSNSPQNSFIDYVPLDDGLEYISLRWQNVEQSNMERLIRRKFVDSDFQPYPTFGQRAEGQKRPEGFPRTWGVMF